MGIASTHSEGSQRFMQLTQQISDKVVRYVEEQVWCVESMVKGKIPTTPWEDNNIPMLSTNTRVGFGLGPAMGGKLSLAPLVGMRPLLNIRVHLNNEYLKLRPDREPSPKCRLRRIYYGQLRELLQELLFATHLEEALSQIQIRFPYLIGECDVEHHLCDHLFYGMLNAL